MTDSLVIDLEIECDECPCERADNVASLFISNVVSTPNLFVYWTTQSCPHKCKEITYCFEPDRIPKDMESDKLAQECSVLNMTKQDAFSPSNLIFIYFLNNF